MNRYGFYAVFHLNPATNLLVPNIDVWINGFYYPSGTDIPKGTSFGGLDLYGYMGRDIAAYPYPPQLPPAPPPTITRPALTIMGFF